MREIVPNFLAVLENLNFKVSRYSQLKNHRWHLDHYRSGGIASFMRVPIAEPPKSEGELDVVFLGIPLDTATSNRPGAR